MGEAEKMVFVQVSQDFARGQPDLLILDPIPGMSRCQGRESTVSNASSRTGCFADALRQGMST